MTMLSVAVTSALLGIAAIVIRKLFGSRTGIKPFIIMWAVVFIKFAVPVEALPKRHRRMIISPRKMPRSLLRKRRVPFILSKAIFP